MQTIVAGIEATEVVPGRTEYIDLQQNFQVLVDSADTPEALSRLLDDVKMSGARKILLVFGCEGNVDVGKRPYMGEVAHYKVSLPPCCMASWNALNYVFRTDLNSIAYAAWNPKGRNAFKLT